MIGPLLVILHAVACLVLMVLRRMGYLRLSASFLAIAWCVPVAGPIALLVVAYQNDHLIAGSKASELEDEAPGDEDDVLQIELEDDETADAVPLQDALLTKSSTERRAAILDALLTDPTRYASSIAEARGNSDAEVSHFASTAMAEMSKAFDGQFRTFRDSHERYPDNVMLLSGYLDFMERYLASDLLQGQMKNQMEELYDSLLWEKRDRAETLRDDLRLSRRLVDSGKLGPADDLLAAMEVSWPKSQEIWMMRLRYHVAARDAQGVRRTVASMGQAKGLKTEEVREALDFWGRV